MRPWDAIVTAQVALGLAPEILDAVDVVSPVGELLAVVDAHVAELGHVEHVVGLETVAIDHSIGLYARPDDGKRVFDPTFGMITAWTLPPRLSSPKTGTLPPAPRPRLPLRRPPK